MADELLDIVDEDNRFMGRQKRELVHRSGTWHRGVHLFLFTREEELIVQVRAKGRRQSPGTLDCSVSEHLKAGEGYLEGALRGLREELGIGHADLRPLIRFKMNYGPGDNKFSELYEGHVDRESVVIDTHEVDRVLFHTIPEVETLLAGDEGAGSRWFRQLFLWYTARPSDVRVIHDYRKGP